MTAAVDVGGAGDTECHRRLGEDRLHGQHRGGVASHQGVGEAVEGCLQTIEGIRTGRHGIR